MKSFLSGLGLFCLGVFLITQNTIVRTGFSFGGLFGGYNPPFGMLLIPILIGIVMLFVMDGSKQIFGWLFVIGGILTVLLGILMGLQISFKPTTLYILMLMYGSVAAGIGLIIKGVIQSNQK